MRKKSWVTGWMAIKLDLEKAYDRMRWSFIRDTLECMKLPRSMTSTIMHYISSCLLNILWNGEPTEMFQPSRGICHPLSSYIFVACMERLSHLIENECQMGRWKALQACRGEPRISNLIFADDVLLFAKQRWTKLVWWGIAWIGSELSLGRRLAPKNRPSISHQTWGMQPGNKFATCWICQQLMTLANT